jgi:hypothetical protein
VAQYQNPKKALKPKNSNSNRCDIPGGLYHHQTIISSFSFFIFIFGDWEVTREQGEGRRVAWCLSQFTLAKRISSGEDYSEVH